MAKASKSLKLKKLAVKKSPIGTPLKPATTRVREVGRKRVIKFPDKVKKVVKKKKT